MSNKTDALRHLATFREIVVDLGETRRAFVDEKVCALDEAASTGETLRVLRDIADSSFVPADRRGSLVSMLNSLDELYLDGSQSLATRTIIRLAVDATTHILNEMSKALLSQFEFEEAMQALVNLPPQETGKRGGDKSDSARTAKLFWDTCSAAEAYIELSENSDPSISQIARRLERDNVGLKWKAKRGWLGRLENSIPKKDIERRAEQIRAISHR